MGKKDKKDKKSKDKNKEKKEKKENKKERKEKEEQSKNKKQLKIKENKENKENKEKNNKKEKKEKKEEKQQQIEGQKKKSRKEIKEMEIELLHDLKQKDDQKAEMLGLTNDFMDPMTLSKAFLRISPKEDGKGASKEAVNKILKAYDLMLSYRSHFHFGYPYNLEFENEELFPFLRFSINNLGDPFVESNYGVHSRMFELEVLDYYANLWKIDKYWGYVTCSGTEGNLHGLYVGRESLNNPVLYASIESHYSIFKAARFYKIDVRPIPTLRNGQIDYEKFEEELKKNLDRDVLLNANVGTTVKGAIDDVDKLINILEKNNFNEKNTFIHCDGALFGLMVPFLSGNYPEINFTKKMIKSVSVSGHKFLGCPMPCGVVIHRKENIKKIETPIPYLNSVDTTIMGSRNGQASLFMWLSLKKKGTEGIKNEVARCCEYSKEFAKLLDKHNISHMLNEESNTIVLLKPPSDSFVKKWQLACVDTIAHAIVMPSTTLEKINLFVDELVSVFESLDWPDICVESHIGSENCRCSSCHKK